MKIIKMLTALVLALLDTTPEPKTEKAKPVADQYIYWSGVGSRYVDVNGRFVGNFPHLRPRRVVTEFSGPFGW